VRAQWRNQRAPGDHGVGHAVPFPGSTKTGQFWFFGPDNIELIVKALDAYVVDQHFWVFYGALSNVEYWITVVDTARGLVKTYHNPPGELCGNPDTEAFPSDGSAAGGAARAPAPGAAVAAAASDPCLPGGQALCLAGGRFEVTVDWAVQRTMDHGVGTPIPDSDTSGFFWFFEPQNVELAVKVPDFRMSGGNFGFFYGALSDVEYTITVRDTLTGLIKFYNNDQGNFCGQADTAGFPDPI
jgi:hypothetical protein